MDKYDVAGPRMALVAHGENTTFRVFSSDGGDDQYLLRVHRPTRHGRDVDSQAAITSELEWLVALAPTRLWRCPSRFEPSEVG